MHIHQQRIGKPHITMVSHGGLIVWRAMIRRSANLRDTDQFIAMQLGDRFPQDELARCK